MVATYSIMDYYNSRRERVIKRLAMMVRMVTNGINNLIALSFEEYMVGLLMTSCYLINCYTHCPQTQKLPFSCYVWAMSC